MRLQVDGRGVFVYTGGRPFDPAAPTVAFVHGTPHDHSVWGLQTRWLAHHGWSVLAFDLPGHGRSDGPPLSSIEAIGDWLLRAIAAAGASRAVIVGHSMGSLAALEAAGRAPAAVAGVGLVGISFPMRVSDTLMNAARDDEAAAFDMANRWSYARLTHPPGAPAPGCSAYVAALRLMERQPRGTMLADLAACDAWTGGLERARALRCPALFVLGERDQMAPPRQARALIDAIPGARVVEVRGCSHAIPVEGADELRDALTDWLRGPAFGSPNPGG